jgi:hypothetical protein
MARSSAYDYWTRALGAPVLGVFLFGLTSGPLRPCDSHPGHSSGVHEATLASEHIGSHGTSHATDRSSVPQHRGCSCLGRCSVEQTPYLPGADVAPVVHTPAAPKALAAASTPHFAGHDRLRVPLARPPPAVV